MVDIKQKTPVIILREFFGYRPGLGLKDFTDELKLLTDEEKLELARLAANELGCTQDQVSFPLTNPAIKSEPTP